MIQLAFHGFCMAVADSVPGVSGGTVAFILGFYDRFIEALHNLFGKDKEGRRLALSYLVKLGLGWVVGMGICAWILSDLFAAHIYFMSSVFLGLTAASIPFVIVSEKDVLHCRLKNIVFTALGAALVIGLSLLRFKGGILGSVPFSALQFPQLAYIFLSGMIAIAAMVLPGISGSTVLLIAGVYLPTINAVKEVLHLQLTGLPGLVALGMGIFCGAGLTIHFIRAALQKHRSVMIYLILGFMLGSLFAIACGPMTLSEPLPAVDFSTFRPTGFILGIAMLLGLEFIKNRRSPENTARFGGYGRRSTPWFGC